MLCPLFPDSWEGKRLIKKTGSFSPQRRQSHRNLVELEPSVSIQRETLPEQMRRYRWVTLGSRVGRKETQKQKSAGKTRSWTRITIWCTSVKRAPASPKVTESNTGSLVLRTWRHAMVSRNTSKTQEWLWACGMQAGENEDPHSIFNQKTLIAEIRTYQRTYNPLCASLNFLCQCNPSSKG